MHVLFRRTVAAAAGLGWLAVIAFCIAGPVSGFGDTTNMTRFFAVILVIAAVLTICAVVSYAVTPLVAHGLGVRAAFRAGRDTPPPARPVSAVPAARLRRQHHGKHRDASAEGSVLRLVGRR